MARIQRQGRLFAPLGMYKGSSERLDPEEWLKGSSTHTVAWHATTDKQLVAYDSPSNNPALKGSQPSIKPSKSGYGIDEYDDPDYEEEFDDDSVDDQDRPMSEYGSAVGLHFGTLKSAQDRADSKMNKGRERRPINIHPVAIQTENIKIRDRGERPEPYSDREANYSSSLTDAVEEGKAVAYKNEVEDVNSVSYRAQPQSVKTWGETVLDANDQHSPFTQRWGRNPGFQGMPQPSTAQVEAARRGYNPVSPYTENLEDMATARRDRPQQGTLFPVERWEPDVKATNESGGHYTGHFASDEEARASGPGRGNFEGLQGTFDFRTGHTSPEERRNSMSVVQFRKTGLRQ